MRAKPKFCECGNRVTVFYANHWICGRCRDLAEKAMYQRRVMAEQNQERGGNKKMNITSITYMRARRTNMVGRFCDCGNPATVCRGGYFICGDCARLESLAAQIANRRQVVGTADDSTDHLRARLLEGRRLDSSLLDPDMVQVTVTETTEEIVVHAHGEYHLKFQVSSDEVASGATKEEGVCGV